ncbi:hypothetical protein PV11_05398 [Exophiala sideris]|uniref:Major facilitator superfamily (MFS) profile domain-containing protein n=1 Tax=Exophiala sideris TaxID=1016849 RepID=A0A0D1X6H4_9EURO|nr:hypothetical protein PV11_05398 [Exophiala sideris]
MASITTKIPRYLLATVILLGGFSRFTHGVYTPQYYAFQEYHARDDGSTVAQIVPVIDTLIGLSLLLGNHALKLGAAVSSLLFVSIGMAMQMQAGKSYGADVALVALAAVAVISLVGR